MSKVTTNIENYSVFHLAIDDTDSAELGGCTTYLGTELFLKLSKTNPMVILEEFPFLIRLNPNVPFRTKGNGSVIIKGLIHPSFISWFESTVIKIMHKHSKVEDNKTNPGLVIWYGPITSDLLEFGKKALWDIIELTEIEPFVTRRNVFSYFLKGKRGLVGCLAGIGLANSLDDFTFELLQYRYPPYTSDRHQNPDPVWIVPEDKYNLFNCIDKNNKTIKIFPKGVDPVFCGIRGDSPNNLLLYWNEIQPQPKMEYWMIFTTNQGTDAHILTTPVTNQHHPKFLPYRTVMLTGFVNSQPITELGGHVSFQLKNSDSQNTITCYAYEPTKEFRLRVLDLIKGDKIIIAGNIRPADPERSLDQVINIEKLTIVKLQGKKITKNPVCPKCLKRMESAGKNQPFRCKTCKTTTEKSNVEINLIKRQIKEKAVYLPAIDAQRHLTKPLNRKEKNKFNDKKETLMVLKKIFNQIN